MIAVAESKRKGRRHARKCARPTSLMAIKSSREQRRGAYNTRSSRFRAAQLPLIMVPHQAHRCICMTVPPDVLKAFIEGKLAHQETGGVEAQIANDPELAAYVEDQKAFQAALASPPVTWLRQVSDRATKQGESWIPAMAMAAGIGFGG